METEHTEKILRQAEGKTIVFLVRDDPIMFQGHLRKAPEVGEDVWAVTGSGAAFKISEAITKYFCAGDLVSLNVVGALSVAPAGQIIQPAGNARVKQ